MRSHDNEINHILAKLFEIKELLIHGLSPNRGAVRGNEGGDGSADENLLIKFKHESGVTLVIDQLSSNLALNAELDAEFKQALSRYLKVSLRHGLERPRNDKDKAHLREFLTRHLNYFTALQSVLNNDELMQKLRKENRIFLDYLHAGKFKQFPLIATTPGKQQLHLKHNKHRQNPLLTITQQPKQFNTIHELNQHKLHFFTPEEIKQEQENFYRKIDEQVAEEEKRKNGIVTRREINDAFTARLSQLSYALPVTQLLARVNEAFCKAGTITTSYLEEVAQALAGALQDSSEVHAVFRIVVNYLKDNDTEKLKNLLREKSNQVTARFEKFNILAKQTQQADNLKAMCLVTFNLIEQFNMGDVILTGASGRVMKLEEFLIGILKQEIERIKHDFRLYEGSQTSEMIASALQLTDASLKQYGNFVKELLSLRYQYRAEKTSLFNVNNGNKIALNALEAQLTDAMYDVGSLNLQELYLNVSPSLQMASEQSNISSNLKNALHALIEKYDSKLNPNQRKRFV